jgi:hypothetical protein
MQSPTGCFQKKTWRHNYNIIITLCRPPGSLWLSLFFYVIAIIFVDLVEHLALWLFCSEMKGQLYGCHIRRAEFGEKTFQK